MLLAVGLTLMNTIASFYLGAKHWQLFLLSVALTVVQVFALVSNATLIGNAAITKTVCGGIDVLFLLGWMWAAGMLLNALLPPSMKRDPRPFAIALVLPFVLVLIADFVSAGNPTPPTWVLALSVVTFACLFFDIGFVADVLRRVEKPQAMGFGGMAATFFGIWFFVIGIWWIQPKINRYYAAAAIGAGGQRVG
jgi:hypothetical protein